MSKFLVGIFALLRGIFNLSHQAQPPFARFYASAERGGVRLLQLLAQNKAENAELKVTNGPDSASIYLYDAIDKNFGVSARAMVDALDKISAKTIHLHINSPGGDVFEARAIKSVLERHPANIVAHIDGVAASAATFVMMAADEVLAVEGSLVMIHNAWAFAIGNAEDLRQTAGLLEKVDAQILDDYAKKSGKGAKQLKAWMNAETWFTPQEAIDAGLIDGIDKTGTKAAARFNLSAYANAPAAYGEESTESEDDLITDGGQALRDAALARLELIERG